MAGQRVPNGIPGPSPVTGVSQESISTYRPPPMSHPTISSPHPNNQDYHAVPLHSGQYGQPVAYQPSPYLGQYSGPGQAQMRRKQNNFDCQYKDVPPPKQDRRLMQLQDSVNNISDVLKDFIGEFSVWRQNVESRLLAGRGIETTSNLATPEAAFAVPPRNQSNSRMPTPSQGKNAPRRIGSMKTESPMVPYSHMSPGAASASTPIKQEAEFVASQQPATPAESVRTDASGVSNNELKERSGLQSDHKTPAHILLDEWNVMKEFTEGMEYFQRLKAAGHALSDYPMQLEQERGLLRVWWVGEGVDFRDGAQGPGSPESSNDSDAPSPVLGKEGLWGHTSLDHKIPSVMSPVRLGSIATRVASVTMDDPTSVRTS
ncbi:hypothetical protein PMIN01_13608 [Paraphaeosphaeria minitans]|uniref:Uncharacterized protein n=1 Tax=Paraphaeosphaeria minitans TaxID=565426 RepID=A0A9P6G4W1_9PLEO|nr:hypothetical protein PMIN01_13608 [Paraphaeosphaeria minitans]